MSVRDRGQTFISASAATNAGSCVLRSPGPLASCDDHEQQDGQTGSGRRQPGDKVCLTRPEGIHEKTSCGVGHDLGGPVTTAFAYSRRSAGTTLDSNSKDVFTLFCVTRVICSTRLYRSEKNRSVNRPYSRCRLPPTATTVHRRRRNRNEKGALIGLKMQASSSTAGHTHPNRPPRPLHGLRGRGASACEPGGSDAGAPERSGYHANVSCPSRCRRMSRRAGVVRLRPFCSS